MSSLVRRGIVQGVAKGRPLGRTARALPWTLPATILISGVVLYPAGFMIYNSTREISLAGIDHGPVGFKNYLTLLSRPELFQILVNTFVWVVVVVAVTLAISLALAQFLDKQFPGRQWVRMAVLVPWASSVVMTTTKASPLRT